MIKTELYNKHSQHYDPIQNYDSEIPISAQNYCCKEESNQQENNPKCFQYPICKHTQTFPYRQYDHAKKSNLVKQNGDDSFFFEPGADKNNNLHDPVKRKCQKCIKGNYFRNCFSSRTKKPYKPELEARTSWDDSKTPVHSKEYPDDFPQKTSPLFHSNVQQKVSPLFQSDFPQKTSPFFQSDISQRNSPLRQRFESENMLNAPELASKMHLYLNREARRMSLDEPDGYILAPCGYHLLDRPNETPGLQKYWDNETIICSYNILFNLENGVRLINQMMCLNCARLPLKEVTGTFFHTQYNNDYHIGLELVSFGPKAQEFLQFCVEQLKLKGNPIFAKEDTIYIS